MTEYRKFKIGELFDVVKGKRLTKSAMKPGNIPFIGASAVENGVTAHIGNEENLHDGNKITVAYNGAVGSTFYQPDPFVASDDVNVLYPKFEMNERNALFIMAAIKKTAVVYSYTHKWDKAAMEESDILLPITPLGDPDFAYMEERIAELEQERIAELDAYLAASGLDDYELTDEDKEILSLSLQNPHLTKQALRRLITEMGR